MSRPITALIVDDEPHLRTYLKLILKQIGFERIYEASNGQEGVELHQRWHPDFTLMDVNMPVKEGIEALKEIMEADEDAVVVMASSVASRQAVEKSLEYGASYYVRKDTEKDELIELLSRLVEDIWGGDQDE